jgi:hypothetical protein
MNEIALCSSVLAGFQYDLEQQQLCLRFRNGEWYIYETVPPGVIQCLIDAPSHGKYFNSAIRGRFPCRRLS